MLIKENLVKHLSFLNYTYDVFVNVCLFVTLNSSTGALGNSSGKKSVCLQELSRPGWIFRSCDGGGTERIREVSKKVKVLKVI